MGYAGAPHVQTISRRSILLGGTSAVTLALGFAFRSFARETITLNEFLALSATLTGVPDLDATAAGKLLDGFLSTGHGAELAAMIAEGESGGAFADEIVAAWYSGRYATAAGPAAFNLPDALLWRALDFTKPPGRCGGSTGYWSEEPKL
jgi:hypothetical protein